MTIPLARRRLRELPEDIARLQRRIGALSQDIATARTHAKDPLAVGERICLRDEASDLLAARLTSLPASVHEARNIPLGRYRGLRFGLALSSYSAPEVFVEGAMTCFEPLSRDFHGPRAILNAVKRLTSSYDAQCTTARKNLAIAQDQLRDYQARLGASFPYDTYLMELTGLRDQLKTALSIAAPDPAAKPLPPAHELADQIKALKAAHTIEAAPQRLTARSVARADEPITACIRHRVKDSAMLPPGDDAVLPAAAAQPSPHAASTAPAQLGLFEVRRPPAPAKPRTFHQEHVSPDKRTPKRQMSLF